MMIKFLTRILIGALVLLVVGCSADNASVPCPNYGEMCSKTPINSWNYEN